MIDLNRLHEAQRACTPVPWRDLDAMRSHLSMTAHHIAQDTARARGLDDFVAVSAKSQEWLSEFLRMGRAEDAAWAAHDRLLQVPA